MRASVLIAAVLLAVPVGRAEEENPEQKPDPDLTKLQGKWRLTYHETAGADDSQDNVWEMVVKGDKFTLTADGTTTYGTIKLDSSKAPKQVEFTVEDEDGDGTTYVGIYELNGDTYKTCDVEKGKESRPTEFKTKAKTGQVAEWKKV